MRDMRRAYDIEERLVRFAVAVMDVVEKLPATRAGGHIAGQLVRCGTSPAANYGEAQAAESRKDFVHKMKIALKELRETRVWLRIMHIRSIVQMELCPVLKECEELIRVFNASVQTARRNANS